MEVKRTANLVKNVKLVQENLRQNYTLIESDCPRTQKQVP